MLKYIKTKRSQRISWQKAPDVSIQVDRVIRDLGNNLILRRQIHCFRSTGSSTRATARIWGLARIWQLALNLPPAYIIEVIAEKYDRLDMRKQNEVLVHEIAHIPNNFSGALVPHIRRGKGKFKLRIDKIISRQLLNR